MASPTKKAGRSKSAMPGPSEPLRFEFGKDGVQPGQFVATAAGVASVGRPPSAGYRFRGQCGADGQRQGTGVERWPDQSVFRGTYRNGQPHQGTLKLASGASYDGELEDGMFHGLGCLTLADGCIMRGTFVCGKLDGHGVEYDGDFRQGQRHGTGRMVYGDGSVYEGDWESGQRHGMGTLRLASGLCFTGQFVRDRQGAGHWSRTAQDQPTRAVEEAAAAAEAQKESSTAGMRPFTAP